MNTNSSRRTAEVLGVPVHPLDMESALAQVKQAADTSA